MRSLFLIPALILGFAAPAYALDETSFFPPVNRLVFDVSQYNPLGDSDQDHRTAVGIEYRFATVPVLRWFHPWIGFSHMGRGAMWLGAGLETDIDLSDRFVLTLQTGPGYINDGDQNKANNVWPSSGLIFRSRAELAYILGESGARIGVNIGHISNAKTSDSNPGIESVGVNVHLPVDVFALGN